MTYLTITAYIDIERGEEVGGGGGGGGHYVWEMAYRIPVGMPWNTLIRKESVFIEIESTVFDTKSNIIVGVTYRMPDSSVDVFNEMMCDILSVVTKEKKICYLIGDLNIDLLKHEEHRPTSDFVDILYANNMFPLIVKPTRVTDKSAALIDHIMTNNLMFIRDISKVS